jgi:hypothetical protein
MLDVPGEEIVWIDGDKVQWIERPWLWVLDFLGGATVGMIVEALFNKYL